MRRGLAARVPLAVRCGFGIGLVNKPFGRGWRRADHSNPGADVRSGYQECRHSKRDRQPPTVITGLIRYAKDGAFDQRVDLGRLVVLMGAGSMVGAVLGGILVPRVPAGAKSRALRAY